MPTVRSNVVTLEQSDPLELLTHMAAYGFAAIIEAAAETPPTLSWRGGVNPRLRIEHKSLSVPDMAQQVRDHATRLSNNDAWPGKRWEATDKGLMSPRIPIEIKQQKQWKKLQQGRHEVLDALANAGAWLDLRFLWSLGEPCYWRKASNNKASNKRKDKTTEDDDQSAAVSRLDLQPPNGGREVIATRVAPLASDVSKRTPAQIVDAFHGTYLKDSRSKDDGWDSRSAIGFRGRGPVDDAVSWCAIWGISQFALNQALKVTTTASCMIHDEQEWVCIPVWQGQWTPARLRTILASRQLRATARAYLSTDDTDGSGDAVGSTGAKWLLARGVHALILFPFKVDVSSHAKPRHAQRGIICDLKRPRGDIWATTSR
jgi:CRISPR-associated protein Csb3